jgi:hypothetical protein
MTTQPTRGRIRAAAIALCGIAAIATAACAASAPDTAAARQQSMAVTTAAGGRLYHLPVTATDPLSAYGGA